jgi:hypothetical protein
VNHRNIFPDNAEIAVSYLKLWIEVSFAFIKSQLGQLAGAAPGIKQL